MGIYMSKPCDVMDCSCDDGMCWYDAKFIIRSYSGDMMRKGEIMISTYDNIRIMSELPIHDPTGELLETEFKQFGFQRLLVRYGKMGKTHTGFVGRVEVEYRAEHDTEWKSGWFDAQFDASDTMISQLPSRCSWSKHQEEIARRVKITHRLKGKAKQNIVVWNS